MLFGLDDLDKAARKLQAVLPTGYTAEVFQSVIDMPIDPDHIEIYKGGRFFHRTIARLYPDDESGELKVVFEDPVEEIIKAVSSLTVS